MLVEFKCASGGAFSCRAIAVVYPLDDQNQNGTRHRFIAKCDLKDNDFSSFNYPVDVDDLLMPIKAQANR